MMAAFIKRAIADWNAWESELEQVLAEAEADGWTIVDESTFFGVKLKLSKGDASGSYNGKMSEAAESIKAILRLAAN